MVIDLAPDELRELAQAAREMDMSEAELTRQAVQRFLASRTDSYRQAIAEGDADFANGNFLSHEDAVASFSDLLNEL